MSYLISARYGAMHHISNFVSPTDELRLHDKVVLRTDRGTEIGEVVSPPEYIMRGTDVSSYGQVIRKTTKADAEALRNIDDNLVMTEVRFCEKLIRENRIPMKLATVEHLFGGEKIIFYFLAEGRIDFRQLVKDLASEYHTRIEMRQIGVRDEARLLAEYEHCGRPLCCKSFIRELQPVTMRMAKSQKTTLDPAKISGRCGRLMCCLRFEDETYGELKSHLPGKGDIVTFAKGSGRVVSQDILSQLLTLELADGSEIKIPVDEILEVVKKNGKEQKANGNGQRDEHPPRQPREGRNRSGRPDRSQQRSAGAQANHAESEPQPEEHDSDDADSAENEPDDESRGTDDAQDDSHDENA